MCNTHMVNTCFINSFPANKVARGVSAEHRKTEGQRSTPRNCCYQPTATQAVSSRKPYSTQSLGCLGRRKTTLGRGPAWVDGSGYQAGGKGIFSVLTNQCMLPVESYLLFEKLRITDTRTSLQFQWGVIKGAWLCLGHCHLPIKVWVASSYYVLNLCSPLLWFLHTQLCWWKLSIFPSKKCNSVQLRPCL